MTTYLWALGCVIGLSIGQVLFKATAMELNRGGVNPRAILLLGGAMALYGLITLAWVWLLKSAELGKIYPFMALAFIFVPVGTHFLFGEAFTPRYFLGVSLIMAGLVVTYWQG